jgi:hypothetical protein
MLLPRRVKIPRALALLLSHLSNPFSTYGSCYRCGLSTRYMFQHPFHSTPYTRARSCFPLCEPCWSKLTPAQRLPYYERLMDKWDEDQFTNYASGAVEQVESSQRDLVLAAVLKGK